MRERDGIVMQPIGVVRTSFTERVQAPRQPAAAAGSVGTIELLPNSHFEDALSDLEHWSHIWVLFSFHLNTDWHPRVLPPRSFTKRGVFSTRAPHRPNAIGMSAVKLVRVDGLTLHVEGVDMIDGSPVLDIKPYVPYTDAVAGANHGWLDALGVHTAVAVDPREQYAVQWQEPAASQVAFLEETCGVLLREAIESALRLGPEPHAYRRIRRDGHRYRIAHKSWRATFEVSGRAITVCALFSGYRPRELHSGTGPDLDVHRLFVERWPTLAATEM